MLKISAFQIFHGGNQPYSTCLIKPNFHVSLSHQSSTTFFLETRTLFTCNVKLVSFCTRWLSKEVGKCLQNLQSNRRHRPRKKLLQEEQRLDLSRLQGCMKTRSHLEREKDKRWWYSGPWMDLNQMVQKDLHLLKVHQENLKSSWVWCCLCLK